MSEERSFEENVRTWWKYLMSDPGARARMRRESDIIGVMMNESFYRLARVSPSFISKDTLACIAMVVAHIDTDTSDSVAKLMGRKTKTSDHTVSEQRFRRMIESDVEDAARMLVRILPIIDSRGNIEDIAKRLRYWNNERKTSQKGWIEEYYMANSKKEE